jgi:hypothetical protein
MANEPEKAVNLLWAVDEIIIALFFRKPTLTRRRCSYHVCMTASEDARKLRLGDLSPFDTVVVRCECGRIVEYLPGVLARLHRVSEMPP